MRRAVSEAEIGRLYGSARMTPEIAYAGEIGIWTLAYRIGEEPLRKGCSFAVWTDSDTDWETPQTSHPERSGFLSLSAPSSVQLACRILGPKRMEITIVDGVVAPGEEVTLAFGKGTGIRMQTFVEERRFFHVDRFGPGLEAIRVPRSPSLRVVGGTAVRLSVVNPSTARPGSEILVLVRAEDEWGNPASGFSEPVTVRLADAERRVTLPEDRPALKVPLTAPAGRGFYRPSARSASFQAEGNPCRCDFAPSQSIYWGDFHGGQVRDAGKIDSFYAYAREVSGIDFSSYQRNDHEMSDSDWERQKKTELDHYLPGEFVALPGYEWSADTRYGGDRTVLFPRHGMPLLRSSHSAVSGGADESDKELPDRAALFHHYRLTATVLIPHVGGRQADIQVHEPELEPVLEIASTHGTFEWFYLDSLRRGYTMGVVAGSDGYTGRPGGEFPGHIARRFARSAAAAVRAEALTLQGILGALRRKRTYATSGPRIYLELRAGEAEMGDTTRTDHPIRLSVLVAGTAELERVDVYRRDRIVHTHVPEGGGFAGRWRLLMSGAASRGSYSGVRWRGRITSGGGVFRAVSPVRFDTPRSQVAGEGTRELRWDTANCGYAHGFEFALSEPGRFEMSVESFLYSGMYPDAELPGTMKITLAPAEAAYLSGTLSADGDGDRGEVAAVSLGPIDRQLTIEPVMEGRSSFAEFDFTDTNPSYGVNPYWIRVIQRDRHCAWSSPIFVDFA